MTTQEASMYKSFLLRTLAPASCAYIVSMTLVGSVYVSAQAADAAAHKAWMNEASDAQEDYRFAISGKDMKAATEALGKLEMLMARTEDYWAARKAADGVKLSKEARGLAAQALAAVKGGNLPAAGAAFDKMGVTCNSCHELHLEKR
jgi:hypothetical protein